MQKPAMQLDFALERPHGRPSTPFVHQGMVQPCWAHGLALAGPQGLPIVVIPQCPTAALAQVVWCLAFFVPPPPLSKHHPPVCGDIWAF